jgi:hypothetical protein
VIGAITADVTARIGDGPLLAGTRQRVEVKRAAALLVTRSCSPYEGLVVVLV